MTSSQEPPQDNLPEQQENPQPDGSTEQSQDLLQERPPRQPRPRRQRPEQNPALDPRLAQLESQARPSRAGDVSLLVIGVAAFVFGVAMHFYVATSVLDGDSSAESSNTENVVATATVEGTDATATPTVSAQATPTPLPDRTSCDEIRGTQYRSVTEREFFLENCTS